MKACAALVVVACACNQVYGLDETRFEELVDEDRDGVPDGRDNCPAVANADQQNTDGDDRGDACDGCAACMPCDVEPDHDEDGDKLPDGCDPCPADPAVTGDADGDGLGDACDHGARRLLGFDGFATLAEERWLEDGPRWTATNDQAHPDPDLPRPPYALQYVPPEDAPRGPSGASWFIEVAIATPAEVGNKLGIEVADSNGLDAFSCQLLRAAGAYEVKLVGSQTIVGELPPSVRLRLRALGDGTFACELDGFGNPQVDAKSPTYPLVVRLIAERPDNAFAYVLVAE